MCSSDLLLYSGVNVLQRLSPAAIFTQIVDRRRYAPVGDLYYRTLEGAGASA